MIHTLLTLSIGATLGVISRYVLSATLAHFTLAGLPIAILLCNIIGSFLMGIFIEYSVKTLEIGLNMRLFFATGFLGSFTTFSAFSLETVLMIQKGLYTSAGLYILLSVALSIFALYAGIALIKVLF